MIFRFSKNLFTEDIYLPVGLRSEINLASISYTLATTLLMNV